MPPELKAAKISLLKRIVHSILSIWLALLLLFGGTAKEFVHLFAGHEDTVHHYHEHGGLVWENEHHHCTFLSFSLASFVNDVSFPVVDIAEQAAYFLHDTRFAATIFDNSIAARCLRGPPSIA